MASVLSERKLLTRTGVLPQAQAHILTIELSLHHIETSLRTRRVKDELKKEPSKIRDQEVTARLEMSIQKKNLEKAHALFYKGFKAMGGNASKINGVYGKNQISFFVSGALAAKFTPEREGLAGEGWNIKPNITGWSRLIT